MSEFVVDASVAVKWFLPEVHGEHALRLLAGGHTLFAPDLLYAEVGNTMWKRVRRSEATPAEARATLAALAELPLTVESSRRVLPAALEIAMGAARTVYDALYLAVAVLHGCPVVTADRRLVRSLGAGSLAPLIVWIGDLP